MKKIPAPKLPFPLTTNAYLTRGETEEKLGLCLHLQGQKTTNAPANNNLNTAFYARTSSSPPWLSEIKPTQTYAIEIDNFQGQGTFNGFVSIEKVVQSQWEEASKYGWVIEGSLFYDPPTDRVDNSDPFN
jgi:hypothetical protein